MVECDLDEIQARVNASKDKFLEAINTYDSYDGQQIIERFLSRFKGRAEVTDATERETEDLIRKFNTTSTSLTRDVALLLMRMQSTALRITTYIMEKGIEKMGASVHTDPGTSALDVVDAHMANFKAAGDAVHDSGEWGMQKACEIGIHAERVQLMAADIINLRTLTLRGFKDEHIPLSFGDLVEQIRNRQYKRTGITILDEAFDRITEATKELALYVAEKNPVVEFINLSLKVTKALMGKPVDTSGGGTELMNELLSQLRRESSILKDLKDTYADAVKEFDSVDAALNA